jgi:heat-inducible transcriptional repressor
MATGSFDGELTQFGPLPNFPLELAIMDTGSTGGAALRLAGRQAGFPPGLGARSGAVLREIVEQYLETGEPVGSRTLSRRLPMNLSPATIRNVMADLTDAGLLFAPHTSAGRLPTEQGLRLFVDGLLHFGELAEDEREAISAALAAAGRSLEDTLAEASSMLSGLSAAAGLVLAPKSEGPLKHIEFVPLGPGRALVVLVAADGHVENRVIETPPGLPPSALQQAGNYLNSRLSGRPLGELRRIVGEEMAADRTQLDALSTVVVEAGLATWTGEGRSGSLIVRGQARLLSDVTQIERLGAIQTLFERLETQETMLRLLELAEQSEGVRIYIGAESGLFGTTGVATVVAPARNEEGRIVGAIGVIGPTRINYGRIIPVVDYTARVIGRLLG